MNYTADPSDAEHLAGPSPWGSSSPKADRASFPTSSNDVPQSPISAPQEPPFPSEQGSPTPPRYHDAPDRPYQNPPNVGSADEDVGSLDPSQHPRSVPPGKAGGGEQPQYQQEQYATQQQRPSAARYQGSRQQRNVPQYKLQAKVTALERTGRKDPVLRFDVYV
jgi:hypothetical protein